MSSPFQLKFMAKNPVKGFTMAELERRTRRAEKKMEENAAILPQIEGPGNPDFESKDPQEFAGDDTHTYGKKDDSPLNAYVSTAGHFQRMQDNIAAAFTPKKKTGPTSEDKKNQAEEAYWKSKTTTSEENNPFKDLTVSAPDSVDLFDTNVNYDNSKDYSGTYEESEKGNSYNIGQGVDKSKNIFNRFG
jgi:hypothetical protein